MRVLNTTEVETVSGGTWSCWSWASWCKPKTTTCAPKPTSCKPKVTSCKPVKSGCGTPEPTPELN